MPRRSSRAWPSPSISGASWSGAGRSQQIVLDRLTASLAGDSAKLQRPLRLAFGAGNARLEDLALNLAGGSVTGNGALEGNRLRASLVIQGVPLKPFGRLMGQDASGTIDATAELDGPASAAAGHVTLRGRGLKFMGLGAPPRSCRLSIWSSPWRRPRGICSSRGRSRLAAISLSQRHGTVPLLLSARPLAVAVPQSGSLRSRCVRRWQAREAGANSAHGRGPHHRGLSRGARGRRQPGPAGYRRQDHDRQCQLSQPGLRDGAARASPSS